MSKFRNILKKINDNNYFNGTNSVPLVETIIIIIAIVAIFALKLFN